MVVRGDTNDMFIDERSYTGDSTKFNLVVDDVFLLDVEEGLSLLLLPGVVSSVMSSVGTGT